MHHQLRCHTQAPQHDALALHWPLYKGKAKLAHTDPSLSSSQIQTASIRSSERLPYHPSNSRSSILKPLFPYLHRGLIYLFPSTTTARLLQKELKIQLVNHLIHIWIQRLPLLSPCPSSAVLAPPLVCTNNLLPLVVHFHDHLSCLYYIYIIYSCMVSFFSFTLGLDALYFSVSYCLCTVVFSCFPY